MEELKKKLKVQIIEQLNLKDVNPADMGDNEPLFNEGLGLDSIDALELIVLLQQHYGIKVTRAEDGPAIFYSVQTIADFINANRQ